MRRFLAVLLLSALFPTAVLAEQWPPLDHPPEVVRAGVNDVAVLVAVEDYLFVPDVRGAKQNVLDWEVFLRDSLGVPTIKTLVNEQGTREEILAAAESAAQLAGPDSTVWFVFVGHGVPAEEGADGALLGVDVQQTALSMQARGIARAEVIQRLEAGAQKRTVVLLDACFSGQLPSGEALLPDAQPVVSVGPAVVGESTVLMTAAAANEFAGGLPGAGRPAFSYLVLGGMRGWADRSGDGNITADEAVEFARRELLAVPGRRQTPSITGLVGAVLTQNATEPRPSSPVVEVPKPDEDDARLVARDPSARQPFDLRGRSRLFGTVGLGAGAEFTYETGAFLLHVASGLRLSNPDASTRFGLTSALGYVNVTNALAEEVEAAGRSLFAQIDAAESAPELSETTHLGSFSVGPVIEVGQGNLRFFGDLRGGLALPIGGECVRWSFEESTSTVECSGREANVSPLFGARLGIGYKLFEVALHSRFTTRTYYLVDSEGQTEEFRKELFIAGLTAGIGFDL